MDLALGAIVDDAPSIRRADLCTEEFACRGGACPIWAGPNLSTAYGALLGYLLSR